MVGSRKIKCALCPVNDFSKGNSISGSMRGGPVNANPDFIPNFAKHNLVETLNKYFLPLFFKNGSGSTY